MKQAIKRNHTDPGAALVAALVALMGSLGVVDQLGLTGDQVAEILGALMTIAAVIRSVVVGRATDASQSPN